jgi:succinoglycan biosynthesis protein ExoU
MTTPDLTAPDQTSVAILIAAYNAEATLAKAVRSALAQPEITQVCIIDDASTDSTLQIARSCDDGSGRVSVIAQDANQGPAAARNRGLEIAKAAWVGVLDADDFLLPGRIERLLQHAGEADFIADALIRCPHPADEASAQAALDAARAAPSAPTTNVSFEQFVAGNCGQAGHGFDLGFVKPLMRQSFLAAHGIRYRDAMRLGEDYELYARALALGARFRIIPAAGYVSIDRPSSISNRHETADLRRLRDCDDALASLRPLSAPEQRALRLHYDNVDRRLQWRVLIDAVKSRDFAAGLGAFRTPRLAFHLVGKLAEQAWLRSVERLFPQP